MTLVGGHEVLGTSAELTRNHMEIRGIGIINVAAMFGIKSVRRDKTLNLIVTLKAWNDVPDVDRLGMEQEFVKVLGVDIPHITIPVRPGRDLARSDRSRRVSNEIEKFRLQRRAGIERAPDRPHDAGHAAARGGIKFDGATS